MILKKILLVEAQFPAKAHLHPVEFPGKQGNPCEAKEATMEVEAGGYMRRDFKDLSPESKETAREDGVLEARTLPDGKDDSHDTKEGP